jgi:NAD(P)-dependent dehydrogenase (short-subunit alcohol dehydrogenase family)
VPLTGGTFTGPEINGKLLPGASADWQTVLPHATAIGDIRHTLQTDAGEVLSVQSRSTRHGSAEVLARLARGEDADPSEYTFRAAVNLTGFFQITQLAIARMAEQRHGHIVNISTSLVDHADSSRPSALAALTKGGLVAVSRSLAIEYASRGVRVNAVSLGVIKTPAHDPASYKPLEALHPLGRAGEVSDVVDAVLYLERATFVTGETLHVDGGQAAGHQHLAALSALL